MEGDHENEEYEVPPGYVKTSSGKFKDLTMKAFPSLVIEGMTTMFIFPHSSSKVFVLSLTQTLNIDTKPTFQLLTNYSTTTYYPDF
jgi:hypothetical protein